MTQEELINEIKRTAKIAREHGQTIEINYGLPYVAVNLGDGSEYFFQGEEAQELLDSVPDYVNEKDFILWSAQGW